MARLNEDQSFMEVISPLRSKLSKLLGFFLTWGSTGPLFDEDGQVLTHTILGSWEDFQHEAIARGDIEVYVCLLSDHFDNSIKHAVNLLVPIKITWSITIS